VFTKLKSVNIGDAITFTNFTKGEDIYSSVGTFWFLNKDKTLVGKIVPISFILEGYNSFGYDDRSDIKLNVFLSEPLNKTLNITEDPKNYTI